MGRIILETHSIPRQELFSYLYEGQPYVAHEWLADVAYYLSFKLLGMGGVVLLTAVLIASTFFALSASLAQEYEDRLLTMLLLGWGAVCSYWHWVARPHLFSMLFLAVWLVGVDRISRGKAVKLWWLPALMLVWANTHAEFVAGFLVLIAYMAGWLWDFLLHPGEADRAVIVKLAITAGLSALASLLNPFGLGTWTTILSYLGNTQLMSTVNETMPPDFSSGLFIVEFALIVASVAILGLQRGIARTGQVFLLAGFTALAMRSGRNIHLYSVVAPFVLAGPLIEITKSAFQARVTAAIASIESKLKGLVWPVATVLVSAALLLTGKIGRYYLIDPGIFPVEAVTWLEENPQPGHMFNDFLWGGYIMWRLWPLQKDFIDSQSDLNGEATVEYLTVEKLRDGWQNVLEQHEVAWVIMPSDSILSRELVKDGWTVLHRDSTAIILRRD
jgi:hypothetical protein